LCLSLCPRGCACCSQVQISGPLTAGQLAELLQPYSQYQRIHFQNPQFAFSHFEQPKEQEQFQDITKRCALERASLSDNLQPV
jgi:hypothetical protein